MLQYDDSAFYYFSIAALSFLLIPLTWSIFSSLVWGDLRIQDFAGGCKCARCTAMLTIKKQQAKA